MNLTRFCGTQNGAGTATQPPEPPVPTDPPAGPGETPPTLPPTIPPAPAASFVSVTAEGTGVDLLPLEPSLPLSVGITVMEPTEFEASMGYETITTRSPSVRRGYRMMYVAITDAQRSTLLAFLRSHKSTPFLWTAPDDTQRSWYLAHAEVIDRRIVPNLNNIEFVIAESRP